jgi:hypothetical protein
MAMTTFSYVSTVLTQVNITKPCLIGGLSTGLEVPLPRPSPMSTLWLFHY